MELNKQHDMWKAMKLREQAEMDRIANPMVKTYGPDSEARKCKHCTHLYGVQCSKTYYKCRLRGKATHGAGTDHRVNWPACSKFAE